MPKLFATLAKNTNGLKQVYNDSVVGDRSFNAIRALSPEPLSPSVTIVDIRRIQPVYDLYTGRDNRITFVGNTLRVVPPVNRHRNSPFYEDFPTVNPLLTAKYPTKNNTLVEIKPYGKGIADQSYMAQNSPSLPIVSGPRDEARLFNFFKTSAGLKFLARQQVLQGGNVFKQARGYNPLSPLLAAAQYTQASFSNPLKRVDRAVIDIKPENIGRIQQETAISIQSSLRLKFLGGMSAGSNRKSLLGQVATTAISRFIQDTLNRTNIKIFGKKINLGQVGRKIDSISQTLNSIGRAIGGKGNATLTVNQTPYDALYTTGLWPMMKEYGTVTRTFDTVQSAYVTRARESIRLGMPGNKIQGNFYRNAFTAPYPLVEDAYRASTTYTDDVQGSNTRDIGVTNGVTATRYMKDIMNYEYPNLKLGFSDAKQMDGKYGDVDFIKFKIVVPTVFDGGISFRAFVKDFKHSAKGEYDEQRYVGRPERFIVYKGLSRSMTFTLYLVAFSKEELSAVWARANMLNKLVYPLDNAGGYMVPPIVRLTLGNIIQNQPGYITSIDMDFAELPWDLDNEVTQVIKLNINYGIIEKNYITQNADSTYLFADQFNKPMGNLGELLGKRPPLLSIEKLRQPPVLQLAPRKVLQSQIFGVTQMPFTLAGQPKSMNESTIIQTTGKVNV